MMSRVLLIAGLCLLVVSFILFFVWNIVDKIDEVSGKKAKRRTEKLRELNHGTSRVDRLSTRDIYSSIPNTDSVSSDSINTYENSGRPEDIEEAVTPKKSMKPKPKKAFHPATLDKVEVEDGDDIPTGGMEPEEDDASDENPTGYMEGTPEESSAEIAEEATGLMESIKDFYKSSDESIRLLEEQSSIV